MKVTTLVLIIALVGAGYYVAKKKGYIGGAQRAVETSFGVHHSKGEALYQAGKYEEAIAELAEAVKLDPKDPKPRTH